MVLCQPKRSQIVSAVPVTSSADICITVEVSSSSGSCLQAERFGSYACDVDANIDGSVGEPGCGE